VLSLTDQSTCSKAPRKMTVTLDTRTGTGTNALKMSAGLGFSETRVGSLRSAMTSSSSSAI
jgi:hypothetical protein